MPTIYLDVCCLNRPFDDQRQPRVRIETEAVWALVHAAVVGELAWVSSEVVTLEISRTADPERRRRVASLAAMAGSVISVEPGDRERARSLAAEGFGAFDALHIACAERAGVDVLLTTDDRLVKRAARQGAAIRVRVANPVVWTAEGWNR